MYQQELKKDETGQMVGHYICLGGCRGVSRVPGVCQAPDCPHKGHQLVKCNCTDGLHNNFEPMN